MYRTITSFLLLLLSLQLLANTDMLSAHCTPMHLAKEQPSLSVKRTSMIVFHNTSELTLWITHPVKDPGASAGWSTELSTKHWSALHLPAQKEPFELSCVQSQPGHEQQVECSEVLQVCALPVDKKPTESDGAFWAVENSTHKQLLPSMAQRGFEWSFDD